MPYFLSPETSLNEPSHTLDFIFFINLASAALVLSSEKNRIFLLGWLGVGLKPLKKGMPQF